MRILRSYLCEYTRMSALTEHSLLCDIIFLRSHMSALTEHTHENIKNILM
ncbi:unnamed protein product [Chironomus riparius]|uniref:Uncharacterized protein n=1 Tax=Chironomus riparius TaxID=315576 RepID=A0A9N9RHQ5_9DIPT|nr:unnamed protein product [Chironomus riparius]